MSILEFKESLQSVLAELDSSMPGVQTPADLERMKTQFVGPQGRFTALTKGMKAISKEDKPEAGKVLNETKQRITASLEGLKERVEAAALAQSIGPSVDVSLPTHKEAQGGLHPITQVNNRLLEIFQSMGFKVVYGREIETEFACFDGLNTPKDHPARSPQDTYYFPDRIEMPDLERKPGERTLLRTHTSSVQIRTMQQERPPIRIISPGRCFRRDTADATHATNFHQIEGLYVDEGVTIADLKGTLDQAFKALLGSDAKIRFRPHFFPFTEPSFEVDFACKHLEKLGQEWVEIMGCGMVDPSVFDQMGYDSSRLTGFAFGLGVERIAMILHGVDDIRHFYQNDLRFLAQFA